MIFLYFLFCHVPHRQKGKKRLYWEAFPNQTYHYHNVFCFLSWHRRSGSALSGAFCWFHVHVPTSLLFVPATIHIHSRTYFRGDIFFHAFFFFACQCKNFNCCSSSSATLWLLTCSPNVWTWHCACSEQGVWGLLAYISWAAHSHLPCERKFLQFFKNSTSSSCLCSGSSLLCYSITLRLPPDWAVSKSLVVSRYLYIHRVWHHCIVT